MIQDAAIAIGLFALLLVAEEIGFRTGRRAGSEEDARASSQIGVVQGAMLGLLGLLLAFSFAAAGTRFLERQDLIIQEANSIGTAYLRADLLDEPSRAELRAALKRYTEFRIEFSARLRYGIQPSDLAETERIQARMWRTAVQGVAGKPQLAQVVLPPLNDVIDLHSTRVFAGLKAVPPLVLGLLIACAGGSVGVMSYGTGLGGHRRPVLTFSLAAIIGASLWITIDLDRPRAGLMQLSDAPLKAINFEPAP